MPTPHEIRDALAAIHPTAPWLALTLGTFVFCWGVRRTMPGLWLAAFSWVPADAPAMLRRAAQAFVASAPAAILGATSEPGGSVSGALIGLASGLLAPVVHHVLRAAPVPYRGELRR